MAGAECPPGDWSTLRWRGSATFGLNAAVTLHADELPVDEALVRRLIADQLPQFVGMRVHRLSASGSSNSLFRLGDELLVRVPRQPGGSEAILKEARWLPLLRNALPVGVPTVVALGHPAHGYPEHWSIVRWIDGEHPPPATTSNIGARSGLAHDLAGVVRALRELGVPPRALRDTALRSYRAGPLTAIDSDIRACAERCRSLPNLELDVDAVLRVWDGAMAAAGVGPTPATHWLHGDLVAENLLVRDGRLSALLDFGGLAVGDPTVDLAAAWEVFDQEARNLVRADLGLDDRAWLLGRAWALALAVMTLPYYWRTMPERCAGRLAIARQVLMDAELD